MDPVLAEFYGEIANALPPTQDRDMLDIRPPRWLGETEGRQYASRDKSWGTNGRDGSKLIVYASRGRGQNGESSN